MLHLVGYGRFAHAHLDLQFAFDRAPPLDNLRTEEKTAINYAAHIKGGDTTEDVRKTDARDDTQNAGHAGLQKKGICMSGTKLIKG